MRHAHDYLRHLVDVGGSDLHLKAGGPAYVRVDGELMAVDTLPPLTPSDTETFARQLMPVDRWDRFEAGAEADFAYALADGTRFRAAAFSQLGKVGLVLRRVESGGPSFDSLGLPASVRKLAEEHRGLVLVTGPTGSGKTTTTAAMIGHINATRRCHIVTIEDPIEIIHADNLALVDQREIGTDTSSFATALRSAARQDPDVILVGEMRDLETTGAALQAAATGHLVISTLHTTSAKDTVTRIIDLYPPDQQGQARLSLAGSLQGIVCQRLVPRAGGGRVAALEVMVVTSRIQEILLDPSRTGEIVDAIAEGDYYGMQTFDQHLLQLHREGRVTLKDAMEHATSPHDFRIAARAAGVSCAGCRRAPPGRGVNAPTSRSPSTGRWSSPRPGRRRSGSSTCPRC
ncbi:MAG: PilT/PilU family type 4a pilus ATPase [Actinomycetota bacterium]|nr:PilT/PilU family type 4a pilus ATPase [Actinomycetota bacterium]